MLSFVPKLPAPVTRVLIGFWLRRWLILGVAWLVAVAGWLATLAIPDVYESRAQVYINTQTALDTTISEVGTRTNLEKAVRIIRTQLFSRDNLEQLIYTAGLDAGIDNSIELEREIERLAGAIDITSREQGYYIVTYGDADPEKAQRVVSTLLDIFIEQNLSTATDDVGTALRSLDREISRRRVDLEEIDAEIAAFRRENAPELAGTDQLVRRLSAKEEELSRIRDQIAAVSLRRERLLLTLTETPRYASGADLDSLKVQLATLQSQFNENYPDIVRLKQQIEDLEKGGEALPENPEYRDLSRARRAAEDELASLNGRADRIQGEIDALILDMAETPDAESALVSLLRDREQIETIYNKLVSERAAMDVTANLKEGGGAIDYRRYEAPTVAAEPSWPPRGLMALALVALGLGSGAGLALLLGQLDRSFLLTQDLEKTLGLPVLGALSPSVTPAEARRSALDLAALSVGASLLLCAGAGLFWHHDIRMAQTDEAGAPRLADATEGMR